MARSAAAATTDGGGVGYPDTPSPAHSLNTEETSDQLTAAEDSTHESDGDTPKPSESLEDGHGSSRSSPGDAVAAARPGLPSSSAAEDDDDRSYPATVTPSPFSPVALGLLQTHSPDGQSLLSLVCANEELLRQLVFKTNA